MKILLAEDNPLNLAFMKFMLEETGYEVVAAGNGQEAIDLLYGQDFSVVLMDFQMPVLDGIAATKSIRDDVLLQDKANIPIIIMSCCVTEEDKMSMYEAGADGYIEKPEDVSILLRTISKVVVNNSVH
jgi:CheY-like chemotaxis protein